MAGPRSILLTEPEGSTLVRDTTLTSALRRVPMFAEMNAQSLVAFARSAVTKTWQRGEAIFRAGDSADRFFLVLSGCVKVYALSAEGREHVLHLASPGDLVAESAALAQGTYPAWAQATERSELAVFFRERLVELVRRDPDFALGCLAGLSRRLREFVAKIEDLSLRDVTARLAGYLLQNARGNRCVLPVRKAVLAAHLGTVAEPLSRSLRRLKDAGIIREQKSAIVILDPEGLAQLREGDRGGAA